MSAVHFPAPVPYDPLRVDRLARAIEENIERVSLVLTVVGGYIEPSYPETSLPSAELAVHMDILAAARQSLGDLRRLAAARAEAAGLLKTDAEAHPEETVKVRRVGRAS